MFVQPMLRVNHIQPHCLGIPCGLLASFDPVSQCAVPCIGLHWLQWPGDLQETSACAKAPLTANTRILRHSSSGVAEQLCTFTTVLDAQQRFMRNSTSLQQSRAPLLFLSSLAGLWTALMAAGSWERLLIRHIYAEPLLQWADHHQCGGKECLPLHSSWRERPSWPSLGPPWHLAPQCL